VDSIIFYFGGGSDDSVGVWDVVESTLLTEHVSHLEMTHDDIFLCGCIYDRGLRKDLWQSLNWINNLAETPVDEEEVVTLLVNFEDLVSFGDHLLLEIHFKVFC
jgi:hypothetical protein